MNRLLAGVRGASARAGEIPRPVTGVHPVVAAIRSSSWRWALPALLLLGPFLLWPLASMVWRGIAPEGVLSPAAAREVVGDRYYWERLGFTTAQALASTALAVLVGLPGAWVFAHFRFPGRDVLHALIAVPFVLPTIVVALAFQQLLGPHGWVHNGIEAFGLPAPRPTGTLAGILLAHVFYNVAIVVRLVGGVWANLDPRAEEAARALGADRTETFRVVTFPALAPAVASAAALVFTFTFTSFGVVLILGAPHLDTLEVVVYRLATRLVDLPAAAVLSVVQIATTIAVLVVYATLQRRAAVVQRMRGEHTRSLLEATPLQRALVLTVLGGLLLFLVLPLVALVHGAFTVGASNAVTLRNFQSLFEDTGRVSYISPLRAVRSSLLFATGSALIAVVVGLASATAVTRLGRRSGAVADALLMLPLAVPAVVLGFGYLTTFRTPPFDLRGSPWLLLMAHALIGYPFVVRAVLAVQRSLDPHLREAASTLGAAPWRAWRYVELPLVTRALVAGAMFAFAVSLGEFGATLLLQRREFATLPIAIFEALGRPGSVNLGRALAMATILMAVTTAAFLVIERLRYREAGEF